MKIRKLQRNDYSVIDKYMKELHTLHVRNRPDLYKDVEHPYTQDEFFKIVEDSQYITIAITDKKDQVIAFGIVSLKDRSGMVEGVTIAYIESIFVHAEYRHQGIARIIYRELEKRAKEKNAKRIELMVWEFNQTAMTLYRNLGMSPQSYILEKKL